MDRILFSINGKTHSVGCEIPSDLTLVEYIRNYAELRGTKYMCREGGCGACIVSVIKEPGGLPQAVNSCLVSVTSCQGWEVTTIEKVGNRTEGYHPLQETFNKEFATQCGHCTPGWIMSMYNLVNGKRTPTMLEMETLLGSNICRCTGYRPILDACKQFAIDHTDSKLLDIEDLDTCNKNNALCSQPACLDEDWCIIKEEDTRELTTVSIALADGKKWYKVTTITEIFAILLKEGDSSYILIAGNTAKGVYPINEYPQILIDISTVNEIKGDYIDENLVIGAGNTLTETMNIFEKRAEDEYFGYLTKFYEHLKYVAHVAVRNIGTIAGNLMIKHEHNEFPSDIYLLLETVGAQLTIRSATGDQTVNMKRFLKIQMKSKVIINILLPPLGPDNVIVFFKVIPRSEVAQAVVNAGFFYKTDRQNKILETRIVYGNLSPNFNRAMTTEKKLLGKKLFTNETLQYALKQLNKELEVTELPPKNSAAYRKHLALNLFYKGLLVLCPEKLVDPRFKSGAQKIHANRPVSKGRQTFITDKSLWPLNQPVEKLQGILQCSGEAIFTEDLPSFPKEVFAAFVLSTVGSGEIVSIDASKALDQRGVITFYSAKDIPGLNSFTPAGTLFFEANEEVLCSKEVKYFGQPIGIIVAETRNKADTVAKLVKVTYKNSKNRVIDIKEAVTDPSRNTLLKSSDAKDKGNNVAKTIRGEHTIHSQYHMTMETLVCVTNLKDDSIDVFAATQYPDAVQMMISKALKMEQNSIDVYTTRLGGGYGIKISRETQVAVACSLVTKKLGRPCRLIQSLTTNMKAVGKRLPCYTKYEVSVDSTGVIQSNNYEIYSDNGYIINEPLAAFGTDLFFNCYDNSRWNYKSFNTVTDTASNTFCRAPGTLENIAMAECLMERIAYELSLDPLEVRLANLNVKEYGDLLEMVKNMKDKADYAERRQYVDKFNKDNRYTKRGLKFALLRWSPVGKQYFNVIIEIYHGDGSVVITMGAIEMGQGVNTKAAQVCAYLLKIPLDKIKVKGTNTITAPNSFASGGSLTCINAALGVQRACEDLIERLAPFKKVNNQTWEELVETAFKGGVDLQARGFVDDATLKYNVYGVTLAEVELDILTGESEILRVDIIQDVGRSVSPGIDIGQIEGAFVMGLGYWRSEEIVLDKITGETLSNRTWNYFVPMARDIPLDFRVTFKPNSFSSSVILGAKATGEPPICLSVVVTFALREAIAASRLDAGIPMTTWFQIDGPWTVEKCCMASELRIQEFKFK